MEFTFKQYKTLCFSSIVIFLTLHIWIGMESFGFGPLCKSEVTLAPWTFNVNLFTGGCFVTSVLLQCSRISLSTFRKENDIGTLSSYYASMCVNFIAGLSNFSTAIFNWGGTCTDAFGITSTAAQWPEWLVCVPFLMLITLSIDDKPSLSRIDFGIIFSQFLCILFGLLLQTVEGKCIAAILLLGSCVFSCACFYALARTSFEYEEISAHARRVSTGMKGYHERKVLLFERKLILAKCVGYLFQLFPLIYFARFFNLIDHNVAYCSFMLASAFTKIFFSSVCMDAYLEVSHPAVALIDAQKLSNVSRRAFLRYVFHEVRVPLNAISIGTEVLSNCVSLEEEGEETINMIREAVTFMGETLDDVMALQKIEEGSLDLFLTVFSVSEVLLNVESAFEEAVNAKNINLEWEIKENVPTHVIGDKYRIRHILANLVSNAIKYSFHDGKVIITVSSRENVDNWKTVRGNSEDAVLIDFIVKDFGVGIGNEMQKEDIFEPYRFLKQGDFRVGRGSGLGLAICKEIVSLHHGNISYKSVENSGSEFTVTIPFPIPTGKEPPSMYKGLARNENFYNSNIRQNFLTSFVNNQSINSSRSKISKNSSNFPHIDDNSTNSDTNSIISTKDEFNQKPGLNSIKVLNKTDLEGIIEKNELSESSSSKIKSTKDVKEMLSEAFSNNRELEDHKKRERVALERAGLMPTKEKKKKKKKKKDEEKLEIDIEEQNNEKIEIKEKNKKNEDNDEFLIPTRENLKMVNSFENLQELSKNSFKLDLDLAKSSPPKAPKNFGNLNVTALEKFKVLVVDDVLSNRKLLGMLLRKKGFKSVKFAEDGQEAVNLVKNDLDTEEPYDVIFMDNTMPNKSGVEATEELRLLGFNQLIIGLTGNSMEAELLKFAEKGADMVLTKPLKPTTLDVFIDYLVNNGSKTLSNDKLNIVENKVLMIPAKDYFPSK